MRLFFYILLCSLTIFSYSILYAQDNSSNSISNSDNSTIIFSNIITSDAKEQNVVLIEKSKLRLFNVLVKGNNYEIINEYPIIYGINLGDKMVEGDGKTPEGVYYIVSYHSGDSLVKKYGEYARIYGAGSFPLNYPNPLDRLRKKTGYGIWLHGRDPIKGKPTTEGCVALHNKDFEALREDIGLKYPVVITEELLITDNEGYNAKRESLLAVFNKFISSWKNSDFKTFKPLIHEDYKAGSKNYFTYLTSKEFLMKSYKDKSLYVDNIKILSENDSDFVVDTDQFYCAPNIISYGNKRYYFSKAQDGNYKLISEEFLSLDSTKIISQQIEKFIKSWLDKWRSQDIELYMNFYSKNFKSNKMKYNNWYEYKKSLFNKGEKITINISDMKWKKSDNSYIVTFTQKYSSLNLSDIGIKRLILEGCPDRLKIKSESWNKI